MTFFLLTLPSQFPKHAKEHNIAMCCIRYRTVHIKGVNASPSPSPPFRIYGREAISYTEGTLGGLGSTSHTFKGGGGVDATGEAAQVFTLTCLYPVRRDSLPTASCSTWLPPSREGLIKFAR